MGGDGPGRQYEFLYDDMISARTFEIIKCVEKNIEKCNEIDDDKIFISFSELVSYIKELYDVCKQVDENCTNVRNALNRNKWNYKFDSKQNLLDIKNMLNRHREFMVESRTMILDLEAYIYTLAYNLKDCCPFMEFDINADIRNPLACEKIWNMVIKGKHIYPCLMDNIEPTAPKEDWEESIERTIQCAEDMICEYDRYKRKEKELSDDHLWKKANTDEPITCKDLGIKKKSKDGITTYYDGVMVYHEGKQKVVPWKKFKKIIKSIFK